MRKLWGAFASERGVSTGLGCSVLLKVLLPPSMSNCSRKRAIASALVCSTTNLTHTKHEFEKNPAQDEVRMCGGLGENPNPNP